MEIMEQNVKSAVRTVPNQKVIVNKVVVSGRFFQVDEATFTAGCRDLKPTTFLVWQALNLQYFAADKELALSTQQICTIMGDMRLNTVKDAIKELIEKCWLVLVVGNHYELVNPVGRKAPYDVGRKAPYAWGEKRPTGGAKSALEIIREKEYNNNSNNNIEYITNTTVNTTYIDREPKYVSEDDYNQDCIKRTNMNFDDSELPF